FLKIIFLVVCLFLFLSCEDLSFTDEDTLNERSINKQKQISEDKADSQFQRNSNTIKDYEEAGDEVFNNKAPTENFNQDKGFLAEEIKNSNEHEIIQENITIISGSLELTKPLVINSPKVILDMATIKTNHYNLAIIADEFISNHSLIQNFEEEKRAKKREEGKSGGHISILANKARGNLKLVLSGESGGKVSRRRVLTVDERKNLLGKSGKNGKDAVYKRICETKSFLFLTNINCRFECIVKQTGGEDGGDGKQGLPGEEGKKGGDTGSFHLQAYDLSSFHLTEVKKAGGLGSEGGNGSFGGFGGKAGRNGRDDKNLCETKLSRPKRGNKGKRGRKGKFGKNGIESLACLEVLDTPLKTNQQVLDVINKTAYRKAFLNKNSFSLEEIKNQEGVICY
ncbi:MAG: hypothetical protein OXN83_03625, partial [Oligoflexia bacterium]|nr:hypothetical protein [Oligoflexia bacterium]